MTTNDTNGYLPYDDDTFEKNLGYHDGYTEGEHALNELAPNAVSITGAWLKANEEAGA